MNVISTCHYDQSAIQGEHSAILLTFIKLPFVIKKFFCLFLIGRFTKVLLYTNYSQSAISCTLYVLFLKIADLKSFLSTFKFGMENVQYLCRIPVKFHNCQGS